jgi:hypothetical protein
MGKPMSLKAHANLIVRDLQTRGLKLDESGINEAVIRSLLAGHAEIARREGCANCLWLSTEKNRLQIALEHYAAAATWNRYGRANSDPRDVYVADPPGANGYDVAREALGVPTGAQGEH